MRRLFPAVALLAVFGTTACAQLPGGDPQPPDHRYERLYAWAGEVADDWALSADRSQWTGGFVPLQELTSVDGSLTPDQEQALRAGWFRTTAKLPAQAPPRGVVAYPSGTQVVPLLSAAGAYAQLRQGEPPSCPSVPPQPAPAPAGTDPDGSVAGPVGPCTALTVTDATLGRARLRTTRGEAEVPAWRFTLAGTNAKIVRVAVAQPQPGALPSPAHTPTNRPPDPALVAAQHLTRVDGATVDYVLGVGACDEEITAIFAERPDVVVVGGGVRHGTGACTDQLLLQPVSITLVEPLGARPVLDALTGQPLVLTVR